MSNNNRQPKTCFFCFFLLLFVRSFDKKKIIHKPFGKHDEDGNKIREKKKKNNIIYRATQSEIRLTKCFSSCSSGDPVTPQLNFINEG